MVGPVPEAGVTTREVVAELIELAGPGLIGVGWAALIRFVRSGSSPLGRAFHRSCRLRLAAEQPLVHEVDGLA
jgi:hypothetical protein